MKAAEIKQMEHDYIMQTYGRFDLVIKKAKGNYVYDDKGKKYLDFIAGIACVPVGHANKEVAKAISKQAKQLSWVSNLYYTEEQAILAQKLVKISGLKKCFFCNSGAEANEAAIKLAKKISGKSEFVVCDHAFHGRTQGSLSATWKKQYKEIFEPLLSGFKFVNYNDINAIENAISDKTAAVMIEPIQGEAGVIVPNENYLIKVSELCSKKGVLLILDEVQTGNGRTGQFFAYQHFGITPDIVTTAKGLANGVPIGICISKYEFGKSEHASTFGGNNLACAAANATIDYIIKNKVMKNATEIGNYFMKELRKIKQIKEVKGSGLMIGAEINGDAKKVCEECLKNGLLINNTGPTTLRFLPPLIITKKDVDAAIKILKKILDSE